MLSSQAIFRAGAARCHRAGPASVTVAETLDDRAFRRGKWIKRPFKSEELMRFFIVLATTVVLTSLGSAGEPKATTKVEGKLIVPADLASFSSRRIEIQLYKY